MIKKVLWFVVVMIVTVVLLCKLVVHGQDVPKLQIGQTEKVQDVLNLKVLEDGTTVYEPVDVIYQTYIGNCSFCGKPAYGFWKQSTGFEVPVFMGHVFHPVCLDKAVAYLKKKVKFEK